MPAESALTAGDQGPLAPFALLYCLCVTLSLDRWGGGKILPYEWLRGSDRDPPSKLQLLVRRCALEFTLAPTVVLYDVVMFQRLKALA